jgi:hypothetical protein
MLDIFNTTSVVCRQVDYLFIRELPSMLRAIFSLLHSTLSCRSHQGLGRLVSLFVEKADYQWGKSISPFWGENDAAAMLSAIFERRNLDQPIASGRCRNILSPM